MSTKQQLINNINNYQHFNEAEKSHKLALMELLNSTDDCFERHNFPAHVTGSAWVISPDGKQVLMTHHKFLDKWLQFGGHADGEIDIKNVALREAQEESGIMDIDYASPDIFDIDVHAIPENPKKNEPAHFHYDIRYLLRAKTMEFAVSDESNHLKWFTAEELQQLVSEAAIDRMIQKWIAHHHD